ncbi:MAG TPA: glycoside hydrolase family 31 protein [Candidatus Hydrogenedens sp.]|nr:glycoside hydrolase family 31 protein [Candidatus Hydrogenedens sp.]
MLRILLKILKWAGITLLVFFVFIWFWIILPFWGIYPLNYNRYTERTKIPSWVLECWVWEDDQNTADFTLELVNGYIENDFPVRTVLIDSPWSLRYNDFTVDEERFPNPKEFFKYFEDRNIRVVLWMTSMVNSENPDTAIKNAEDFYQEARNKGYLLGNGRQVRWWKGKGGFIDYTNPQAMQWWRSLQNQVLNLGVDGWKLDGSATLLRTSLGPLPMFYVRGHKGIVTTRKYMDYYYREELNYGKSVNPEFATLARSIDSPTPWAHPEGFAPLNASTVNWVGDNKYEWEYEKRGLERAIYYILRSAKLGYCVIGSDIAGYHGAEPIPADLYIRWTQFSTFCGLFLNGGHGERRMWKRSELEFDLVRKYSWLHTELLPYMYSYVAQWSEGGKPLMRPMKEGKYQYMFGDYLLVAPIYQKISTRSVVLPKGKWRWWFSDTQTIEGGQTITNSYEIDKYPVFIKEGAIIPMYISRSYTGIGDKDWEGYLVLNIYPEGNNSFTVHYPDYSGQMTVKVSKGTDLTIEMEGLIKPHILRILTPQKPTEILKDNEPITDFIYQPENQRLIIKSSDTTTKKYTIK